MTSLATYSYGRCVVPGTSKKPEKHQLQACPIGVYKPVAFGIYRRTHNHRSRLWIIRQDVAINLHKAQTFPIDVVKSWGGDWEFLRAE